MYVGQKNKVLGGLEISVHKKGLDSGLTHTTCAISVFFKRINTLNRSSDGVFNHLHARKTKMSAEYSS